jgi:demethylmenaquinone methyltransferase/2-methoxy-6-polyprenyl-1,4-benzoquinol methylase
VCLEITRPKSKIANFFYDIWFDRVVPLLGAIVSRDKAAYTYLPESTKAFPRPPQLAEIISAAGIQEVSWRRFGGGIVAMHRGELPLVAASTITTDAAAAELVVSADQ